MKTIATIARILLGRWWRHVKELQENVQSKKDEHADGRAGDYVKALFVSHYFYVVGALEVAGGALCVAGLFVPLGLTLLGPVIVNILLFHILLNPAGLPLALAVSVLALIVLWHHRAAFAGLVKDDA
jgi:hypothetical protein